MRDPLDDLFFRTGNFDLDKRLHHLAAMSDPTTRYSAPGPLQTWLEGVVGHIEALPIQMQRDLGLDDFKIGNDHFRWNAWQIEQWHKNRCTSLRDGLRRLAVP
ncbi:hypothetical protein H8B02_17725 [Bradyrhizobium sp. Pear77]|uniref:hypothetical protein n=1 Tax=Bradyrhizobium altum TaxID=1571202 RepID=UPI001E3A198A|nr:hypothetical protein [Bradyrhizobium altum]MCC8955207.1 hypothetical protein [Bradyrhizobium altum]